MHKSRGTGLELFVKEVACFTSDVEETILAGDAMMDAGGGQEVPHAVEFMPVGHLETVGSVVADLGSDVAIRALCLCDDIDPFVHKPVELRVLGNLIDQSDRFEPFVTVAIAPVFADAWSFFQAGSDFEVNQVFGIQWIEQAQLYTWEHSHVA